VDPKEAEGLDNNDARGEDGGEDISEPNDEAEEVGDRGDGDDEEGGGVGDDLETGPFISIISFGGGFCTVGGVSTICCCCCNGDFCFTVVFFPLDGGGANDGDDA